MTPTPQYSTTIQVRDYELDSQGIVNNANYLHYLELTRHDFCIAAGAPFAALAAEGLDPVVRKIEIEYISPLRSGDTMISSLSMSRCGAKFIFNQSICRADNHAPVVRATVTVVCLEDGHISRGDRLAARFAQYLQHS